MLSKEEKQIGEDWQFFDDNGFFPFEKRKVTITLSGDAIKILEEKENKSQFIDKIILENKGLAK